MTHALGEGWEEPLWDKDICIIDFFFNTGRYSEQLEAQVVWREHSWQFKLDDSEMAENYLPFKDTKFENVHRVGNIHDKEVEE